VSFIHRRGVPYSANFTSRNIFSAVGFLFFIDPSFGRTPSVIHRHEQTREEIIMLF